MEKLVSILLQDNHAKDVSLAMMVPIIDYLTPEKFQVPIGDKDNPLTSQFQATKKIKKTQTQAFYLMSSMLYKRLEIILTF